MATLPSNWKKPIISNEFSLFKYKNYPPKLQKEENKKKSQETNGDKKKGQRKDRKGIIINNHSYIGSSTDQSIDFLKKSTIEISVDFLEHISESDEKIKRSNMLNNHSFDKDNNVNNKNNKHNNFPIDQNRDIDTFSNYFNHCLENPEWNRYFHCKLFDLNDDEVSNLAYKNANKIQLFDNEKNNKEVLNNETQDYELKQYDIINHKIHKKHGKSLKKIKQDKSKNENSKGLYKPY